MSATPTLRAASAPAAGAPARAARSGWLTGIALVQGLFYLATGVWPLVDLNSFQMVTGPKTDLWLVQTVGALIAVVGVVLLLAAARGHAPAEVALLAVGCALALTAVDVIFTSRGIIAQVYLYDAVAEVVLVAWWLLALAMDARGRWRRSAECL